ncbi:MAG: calcium-binding protein, partial [Cyanobacteria bacterium J06635_10]
EGWDEVEASIDYSLAEIAHVEELNLTGNAIDGTGNSLDNYIRGNELDNVLNGREGNDSVRGKEGNDTLFSSAGKDTLYGGEGDDTYIIDNTETIIVENAGEGTDTIKASINYSIADIFSVRNLILIGNALEGTGSSSSDQITGNALDNILDGGSGGNDTLDGGAGNDTLIGGMGRDTYIVDSTGDTIIEDSSNYTDTVLSSINFSIAEIAYVENLTLTGDALLGTGNSERNVITGNALDNTLNGGSGRDTLIGGAGNDTLIGGADSDVYIVDSVDDVIIENESEGFDDVEASINYSLENIAHVEDLILTGDALKGTGNSLDNRVYGNDLNNTLSGKDGRDILRGYAGDDRLIGGNDRDSLNGGVGKDTLIGGTGNDTYYVENVSDIIIEDYDAGSDKVNSSITWTLGDNLERLTLTGTNAIDGIGNALDNRIEGNDAANKLFGNQGRDTLFGYEGDDWLSGGDGNDNLIGAEGNDTLVGGTGNDKLYGYQGDDMLVGGDGNDFLSGWNGGNDTLIGGAGNDTLSGSSGNDIFVFNNPNEGIDRITSFSPADDTIHISAAGFGGGLTAGDTILEEQILIGSSSIAADNASQRFIYNTNSGALLFDADGNQTGFDAVQIATLFNKPTISASDIFVTM